MDDHHVIMFKFYETLKWGWSSPSTNAIQIVPNKNILNELKMPFKNVHHLWFKVEASTQDDLHFWWTHLGFELNQ